MELEEFISGYCRCTDRARTVTAEISGGGFFADCSFGSCPYEAGCPIARRLAALKAQMEE